MAKQRIAVSLDPETVTRLDRINARRFGGTYRGRSIVVTWALAIAERVLSDPATIQAQSGDEALDHFREGSAHPVPPALADLLRRVDGALKDLSYFPDTRIMDTSAAVREDIAETLAKVLLGRE